MATRYRVSVFGKHGCDKCAVLNQRVDKLLEKPEWSAFEKHYEDVESEAGIVAFAEAECLNPQRIPAMLIARLNPANGEYEPVLNRSPGAQHPVLKGTALYAYVGLQTDYTADGRGVITPKMITACLEASGHDMEAAGDPQTT